MATGNQLGVGGVSITLEGWDAFQRALAKGNQEAQKEMQRALYTSAVAVQGRVVGYTPVNTGTLRKSISFQVDREKAIVGTNLKYAPFLEFGTKAHGPKTKPFLVFKTKDGRWIRTKWVKGITAVKMFERGLKDSTATVTAAFDTAIQRLLSILAS